MAMINKKFAWFLSAFFLALSMIGCSDGMVRVSGKVTFSDGTPVTRGSVLFDSGIYSASGDIQPDGTYVLGALSPGGGVRPGEYIALIEKNWDDPFDEVGNFICTFEVAPRFSSRETSNLKFTVETGKRNVFDIVVERKQ